MSRTITTQRHAALLPILGLAAALAIGCADVDQDVYRPGEPALATFANALPRTQYLPGCTPFDFERNLDGEWLPAGGPWVCFWEGIAVQVPAGGQLETEFNAPFESGEYRLTYTAGAGCEDGVPLSQANCEITRVIVTQPFTVERELCAPETLECRFVPAAPNILCEDGVSIAGPSPDCTRDPQTGVCGYEILSCP